MSGLIIAQSLLRVRINALLRFPEPFCIVLSVHQAVEECENPLHLGTILPPNAVVFPL